jgi:tetratricopeptide (TPR) repeat protein
MKNLFRLSIVPILGLSLALSCKTQKTATADTGHDGKKNSTQTAADYEAPTITGERNDPISEKKAKEEATFMEGCILKMIDNKKAALVEFREVLEMNPDNSAANYEVAGLYHELGQSDRALPYAKRAMELNPDNIWYKFRYAEILQAVHRDAEAISIYQDLIKAEPNDMTLHYRLADCQFNADKPADALATYNDIEKHEGNTDSLARCRLKVYHRQKDDAGVESVYKGLIKSFPLEEKYSYELAAFYESKEQQDKANSVYTDMAVKFPYSATPRLKLAEVNNRNGKKSQGYSDALAAFAVPELLEAKIAYLNTWYNISDTAAALTPAQKKEADSLCRVMRRVHKDEAPAFTVSGDYLMKDNRMKEARAMYRKALDMNPGFYAPWKQILKINAQSKDDVQQEKDCKEVMSLYPSQPDAYYYMGEMAFRKKNYYEALQHLSNAHDYNYDDPQMDVEIRKMQLECYRATGNDKEADAMVEKLIKAEPKNMKYKADLAASLLRQKKEYYRAEQMMLEVIEAEPNNAAYLNLLGRIEYNMGDYKMADDYMRKALAITPNDAQVNERLGDIQYMLKNTDEAVKFWNKAKSLGNKTPELEQKIKNRKLNDE